MNQDQEMNQDKDKAAAYTPAARWGTHDGVQTVRQISLSVRSSRYRMMDPYRVDTVKERQYIPTVSVKSSSFSGTRS